MVGAVIWFGAGENSKDWVGRQLENALLTPTDRDTPVCC